MKTRKDKTLKARLDEIKATPLQRLVANTLFLQRGKAAAVEFVEMLRRAEDEKIIEKNN